MKLPIPPEVTKLINAAAEALPQIVNGINAIGELAAIQNDQLAELNAAVEALLVAQGITVEKPETLRVFSGETVRTFTATKRKGTK